MRPLTPLLSLALAASAAAQEPKVTPTEELRVSVREWVETMRKVQVEENDWERDKEVLQNYREGLEKEIGDLKEQIESARTRKQGGDQQSLDKVAERDRYAAAEEELVRQTRLMEETLAAKIPVFPAPLLKEPKVALGIEALQRNLQLPSEQQTVEVAKRLATITELMAEVEKFQQGVHVHAELRKDGQGREFNMQVVYFGLALAYAVNEDGSFALAGRPGPDGWKFQERNDLAPRIQQLVVSATSETDATFTSSHSSSHDSTHSSSRPPRLIPAQAAAPGPIDNARSSLAKAASELDQTQKEYADLRRALHNDVNRLDDEALTLAKELRTLEREEELRTTRVKTLDREIDTRKSAFTYASGLLNQYSKALITRIHPAEVQLYASNIATLDEKATASVADPKAELIQRMKVLELGMQRLSSIAGGHRFDGKALGRASQAIEGTLLITGPSVFFASADKSIEGIAPLTDTGSALPAVVPVKESNGSIARAIESGTGDLPLDATMGKAIEAEIKHPGGHNKAMEHVMLFGDIAKNMMFDGWIAIGICVLMIAVGWTVAAKKFFYLNSIHKGTGEFLRQWEALSSDLTALDHADDNSISSFGGNADPAAQAVIKKSPLYQIYHIGSEEIRHRLAPGTNEKKGLTARSIQAIRASLDAGLVRVNHKLTDGLIYLTISIAGGPYVGLLGTVVGVMITFAIISKEGEVNVNAIAPGIASALLATVAGLIVAIPALFVYSYLNGRIKNTVAEMQVFIDEFVAKMAEFYPSAGDSSPRSSAD